MGALQLLFVGGMYNVSTNLTCIFYIESVLLVANNFINSTVILVGTRYQVVHLRVQIFGIYPPFLITIVLLSFSLCKQYIAII